MRILLTGATGFVGHALMPCLAAAGHEVVAVTRGDAGIPGAAVWDLAAGGPAPASLPARIDAVIHAAQSRNHRSFPGDAAEMFAVNAAGTAALLDYAARAGASRFCLLSTGSVYEPFGRGLAEDAPLAPTSMLGASKLAAEVVARPYAALFPISVLRIFTPYGPGQAGRLVPNLIERVRSGQPVQVSADGEGMRIAPIYIDDLCAVVATAVEQAWNEAVNVAAPEATTIRHVAEIIGHALEKAVQFDVCAGAASNLAPPVDNLLALFGGRDFVGLNTGLRRLIEAQP